MQFSRSTTRSLIASVVVLITLGLTACGGSDDSSTSGTQAATTAGSTQASTTADSTQASTTAATSSSSGMRVAYLAAANGNAYVDASVKAVQAAADKQGVELEVFDAQFDPQKQLSQCQDAVTQKFDAIVALPAAGVPLTPCAAQAKSAGIPLVDTNQPIGTSTTSGEPTTPGVTSQILTPLATIATEQVDQVVAACGDTDPCNVIYLSAAKILPQQDKSFQDALKKAQGAHANIKVTSVDAGADRAGGLKATQDALQRVSDPTVITAPNTEPTEGAAQALTEVGKAPGKDVQLVTNGGTKTQIAGIKSGKVYSSYVQVPASEATIALDYALKAAAGEQVPTWSDPHDVANIPFTITPDNVNDLGSFVGEW
jgi:ABC-type sugar transport system substrate-binding protein